MIGGILERVPRRVRLSRRRKKEKAREYKLQMRSLFFDSLRCSVASAADITAVIAEAIEVAEALNAEVTIEFNWIELTVTKHSDPATVLREWYALDGRDLCNPLGR